MPVAVRRSNWIEEVRTLVCGGASEDEAPGGNSRIRHRPE
jgi:hypothetical protein